MHDTSLSFSCYVSQVTSHQLQLQQEAEKKAQQASAEEAAKAKKKVVSEDAYSQMVDTQNVNRNANDVEARSVTEALSALGVKEEEDKHPERYIPCGIRLAQLLKKHLYAVLGIPSCICLGTTSCSAITSCMCMLCFYICCTGTRRLAGE